MVQSNRRKHKTNRKKADDPRPEWRFQQPGESRKEYLKRYQREYHRQEWYPGHKKERIQETKDRRIELQEWYTNYKATLHCKNCGEWHPECLQFHHRNPREKEFNVSEWIRNGVSLERLKAEVTKCDVLCANCHAIETQNERFRKKGIRFK
jgi:hypothetical protein